jgi:serine/threonine protein kinase
MTWPRHFRTCIKTGKCFENSRQVASFHCFFDVLIHPCRLVYRDIKQENIGFDVRGDVKVFDFGLCKGVSASIKARDKLTGAETYGYNLTPLTGSIPYMAPEVFAGRPYDGKCDVYSFAILLWEMFTLRPAFKHMNHAEYEARIIQRDERLRLRGIPTLIQEVIRESWQRKPTKRPPMERVASMVRGELNIVSDRDDTVLRRTIHMKDRSRHSLRGLSFLLNEERPLSLHGGSAVLPRASSSKHLLHFSGPSLHNGLGA